MPSDQSGTRLPVSPLHSADDVPRLMQRAHARSRALRRRGVCLHLERCQRRVTSGRPLDQRPDAWGAVAPDYHAFAGNVTRPFAEDAATLVQIGDGTRVIDVAAGTGNF